MPYIDSNHVYSYTQLSSFSSCPYEFYLERIERGDDGERLPQASNAFSEHGKLIHDIIDLWAKGKLQKDELALEYDVRFEDEVVTPFPKMMKNYREKAYQLGHDYFVNFDCFEDLRILATEKRFETKLANRRFVGVIDMLAEDKATGKLVVLDHKSKSLSAFKKEENEMYKQQLLYSKWVNEEYGRFPDILAFNLFKENGKRMQRDFIPEQYDAAVKWGEDTIRDIESFELLDFIETKTQDFFCENICSMRKYCENGKSKYEK